MNHRLFPFRFLKLLSHRSLTILLGYVVSLSIAAGEDNTDPRLIIDPRGPSGLVHELLFTPDGDTLISLGDDKAIRFWDVGSGDLRKTLRLEIGDGLEGKFYAGAISPDGRWLAVGGYDQTDTVRIIDLDTDEIAAVLRGHRNVINGLAFSDDGRWLASGSADDDVRVWDLSKSIGQRDEERATAGPIEITDSQLLEGHTANVSAVDFAPGADRLVSGAYDHDLILWKRGEDGLFTRSATLEQHRAEVRSAAFSPDGSQIVSGGFDDRVLLWDGQDGRFLRALEEDMEDNATTISFSPDGRRVLASSQASGEGYTAIYNPASEERNTTFRRHDNTVMASAWHPSEDLVATAGGDDNEIYLWRPSSGEVVDHLRGDGQTGWAVAFAETRGLRVAFGQTSEGAGLLGCYLQRIFDFATFTLTPVPEDTPDPSGFRRTVLFLEGKTLKKTDRYRLETGSGEIENDPARYDQIRSYSFTPSGDVVVGSGSSLRVHSPTGEMIRQFIGHEGEVWAVSPSPDGRYLASASHDQTVRLWSLEEPEPLRILVVGASLRDTDEGILIEKVSEGFPAATAGIQDQDLLQAVDGENFDSMQEVIEYSRNKSVGDPIVYRINRNGEILNFSMKLKEMVIPQTTVSPLATLFVARNGEWVCWTPSGHYHASPGGEQYIGWHLNKGIDKVADYYPAYVFRDQFHLPELVKRTVLLGDFDKALAEVGAERVDVAEVLPPRVDWILPRASGGGSMGEEVTVRAEISSPGAELEEIRLLVNGKALATEFRVLGNAMTYEETITLLPGENRLAIFARNENAGHTSAERVVTVRGAAIAETAETQGQDQLGELLRPNLYVLAVGVSEYEDESIPSLQYCDDDASAIAELFAAQRDGIFGKTEVRLLVNAEATEDGIQDGLDWLEASATQKDIVVLFLAAHGVNDEKGNFYLLPSDANPERLRSTGVAWDDFGDILGNLPSRVLMFLDTCHSGQLGANLFTLASVDNLDGVRRREVSGLKSAFDPSEAIRELTSEENGVVIMAASTGDEASVESDTWGHGAFTLGILEGLRGDADVNEDEVIHLRELDYFISERVKELTGGRQHPTTVKPSTISRLPVAAVR